MLKLERGQVVVEAGAFRMVLPKNTFYGKKAQKLFWLYNRRVRWIENPRVRCYILVKLVKKVSYKTAMNNVFTKKHLRDLDYRNLIN